MSSADAVSEAFTAVTERAGHPAELLRSLSSTLDAPLASAAFADALDAAEPLRSVRSRFHIPPADAGAEQVYLTGHSLGLQPRATRDGVLAELDKWASAGVAGHWTGELPWASCEDALPPLLAPVVGSEDPDTELCALNTLTVNLHMLMSAFYRPNGQRAAILIEAGAFPSDRYKMKKKRSRHRPRLAPAQTWPGTDLTRHRLGPAQTWPGTDLIRHRLGPAQTFAQHQP